MATKLLYVGAILAAVLAPTAAAGGPCAKPVGDPNFKLYKLCGKKFSVYYSSSIGTDLKCIVNHITCDTEFATEVTMHTLLISDCQEPESQTYVLTDHGNGILSRFFVEGNYTRTQVITSYTEICDEFNMGLLLCSDEDEQPLRKALVANYVAEFTNELEKLDVVAPLDSMTLLPCSCNPHDYFGV